MEGESNGMEREQSQCRAGCGFFGSTANDGLCSVCYKEAVKKKQQPPTGSLKVPSPQRVTSSCDGCASSTPSTPLSKATNEERPAEAEKIVEGAEADIKPIENSPTNEAEQSQSGSEKRKGNRCQICRKKVGLTGFECRCGGLFCSIHRYSDKHNCTFDYRQMGADEIRKNNPVVVGEKIHKI